MKVNKREYHELSELGPYSHFQAQETHNTPKNTMKGYATKAVRVVRNGEVIKERKLSTMVLDLINDRQDTASFRRSLAKKVEKTRHMRAMTALRVN